MRDCQHIRKMKITQNLSINVPKFQERNLLRIGRGIFAAIIQFREPVS
jgi:hypothetical protein